MDILQVITQELGVQKWQVEAAVKLIDEGNTIPFISRYRKEATGTLNDEQLRNLNERLTYLRNLEDKKNQVLSRSAESTDPGSTDTGSGIGSLSSVPSEETYQGNNCQGKRSGAAGKYYYASDDRQVHRGRSRSLCFRGKRGCFCGRCHCWCKGHYCRAYFR